MPEDQDNKLTTDSVELRSEPIQEILGRPPHLIIRWGITLIFSVILILFVGSHFFKYPDIISSEVVITTQNPPSWVVVRSSGKLQQLEVEDKEYVSKNQILAIIENPASPADVYKMMGEIEQLSPFFTAFDARLLPSTDEHSLMLGELQASYISLKKLLDDYLRYLQLDYYSVRRKSMERELDEQKAHVELLKRQHTLQEKDLELDEKQFLRSTELYKNKITSELEYENAQKQVLNARKNLEQSKLTLSNAQITVEKLTQDIIEFDLNHEDELRNMQGTLFNTYEQLKAQVSIWEQQYVLKAQTDGVVSFNKVWSVNQQVNAGDNIFVVVPKHQGELVGIVSLPAGGAGKVKVGQNVNIKLDGYPHMEFGMLKGVVTSISLVPSQKVYTAEVALPNGLLSFYNKSVDFTGELTGTAEISTDEYSVLERFLQPLRYLLTK